LIAGCRGVKGENIVPKLFHEMPTNMITVLAFGEMEATNRAAENRTLKIEI